LTFDVDCGRGRRRQKLPIRRLQAYRLNRHDHKESGDDDQQRNDAVDLLCDTEVVNRADEADANFLMLPVSGCEPGLVFEIAFIDDLVAGGFVDF
jgi:hypothetical protein